MNTDDSLDGGEKMYVEREYYPKKTVEVEIAYTVQVNVKRKRVLSKRKGNPHVKIELKGTQEDFEKVVMETRKAVRKYNCLSERKMSYDINLI